VGAGARDRFGDPVELAVLWPDGRGATLREAPEAEDEKARSAVARVTASGDWGFTNPYEVSPAR